LTEDTLHLYELGGESYAARISNYHTYFAAQHDLIHRWLYPIVPEMALGKTPSKLTFNRQNIYKGQDVVLKKGSILEEDLILGSGTMVGAKTTLFHSVIGSRCNIGANVSIRDCILLDGVEIGDGCQLVGSVIGKRVVLGKSVVMAAKSVLGDNVQLKDGVNLPEETWVVSEKLSSGFSDEDNDEDDEGAEESKYGPKVECSVHFSKNISNGMSSFGDLGSFFKTA
jgi:translation initiation factor eIF-2B subunit epsilon